MVTHLTPDESGRCRCCGKPPSELPLADQFTTDEKKRTCWTTAVIADFTGQWEVNGPRNFVLYDNGEAGTTDEKKRTCGAETTACIVNGEPGRHEWDDDMRKCSRCGAMGLKYLLTRNTGDEPLKVITKTTSVGSSLQSLQEVMQLMGQPKPHIVAVHVSAEGMERIAPKGLTATPPGKCPVLYAGGPQVHAHPALTGDQRILEYSDGTMVPVGFTDTPKETP